MQNKPIKHTKRETDKKTIFTIIFHFFDQIFNENFLCVRELIYMPNSTAGLLRTIDKKILI